MSNFLPNDGTYFDDERDDDERHAARESKRDPRKIADPNSIALVQEINRRPGVSAFVSDSRTQTEFWKVLELWRSRGHLGMVPLVLIDPEVSVGQVSLRMVGV